MTNLFPKTLRAWLPVLLIAPAGFYMGQATMAAGPASGALIDKDFETAVHTFVSKRFYNRIDATEEQRTKLNALWQKSADGTRPMREELRAGMLGLSSLFASDTASDDEILKKAHELRSLHEKIMDERLTGLLKARQVLNHDQRQKIDQRLQDLITGGLRPQRLGTFIDAG